MDDDEPAMAYFLPNGIADDSPPKKSRIKASFGPIGGRSAAVTSSRTATSTGNTDSYSRSDVGFNNLHTRPRPTLDLSPFRPSGGSSSPPRATNFLLSDLGGEIHTPRGFGESGSSTSSVSRPFGYPGAFGPKLSDGGAGAIRSPTSMFDRGQEVAKGFSMQETRAAGAFPSESQLYRGAADLSSYLSAGDADRPFASSTIRNWPSETQPRRRPPGLTGPPGLSDPNPMDRIPSRLLGSDMRVSAPQFEPYHSSTSSPIAATASNGVFTSGEDQYRPSLLSSLRLSTGVFGDSSLNETASRSVSNTELAQLNTQSVKVGDMGKMKVRQAADSSWDYREPTSSRRIDIQAKSKTPRSPKKAREGRRKSEGRSDLRAKALEFSMEAINAFTPSSPARSSTRTIGELAPRGKRRNQAVDKSGASGNDNRRRGTTNQNDESGASFTPSIGLETAESPVKMTWRESSKSKRREDTKRNATRRNSARGNEKGSSTTRRQVYREKVKDTVQQPGETTPSIKASHSPQGSQVSSDGQQSEVKSSEPKQDTRFMPESSPLTASSASEVATPPESVVDTPTSTNDVVEDTDGPQSPQIDETVATSISHEQAVDEPSTERESTSSSDLQEELYKAKADLPDLEEILSPVESSESDAERDRGLTSRQPVSSKKAKRKSATPASARVDTSRRSESQLPVPLESVQTPVIEKKHMTKDHRKEKSKKDKGEKRKVTRSKKEKRGSSLLSKATDTLNQSTTEAQDKLLETLTSNSTPLSTRISQKLRKGSMTAASAGLTAFRGTRQGCIWLAGRLNIKGILATSFAYVESVLAVVFSVVLLLSLHAASWFIRIHRVAFRAILTHRHIGFCFAFLYGFPFLVQYVFPWAPPWAPVCLWYAFLVQLFCTNGPTAMVTTFRVILPLVFLVEGISHHSFLLDLNGAELLLTSFIISALKTSNLCSPIFFLSLATQCLLAVFLGSELVVQWLQLALALYSLHLMAATDDEWVGISDEEEEQGCHSVAMHHSIADYNHHPAPSSAVSIQKTKRLDRRALAYVRGRKLR